MHEDEWHPNNQDIIDELRFDVMMLKRDLLSLRADLFEDARTSTSTNIAEFPNNNELTPPEDFGHER